MLHVRTLRADDDDQALDVMRARTGAYDVTAQRDPDVVRHLLVAYARHALRGALTDAVVLLDTLLDLAAGSDASDVHLVATSDGMRVRQRIDGDLHEVVDVPAATAARARRTHQGPGSTRRRGAAAATGRTAEPRAAHRSPRRARRHDAGPLG